MIREFSVKPKPSNNYAGLLFSITLSLSFALIALSTFIPTYSGIVSLAGVGALTVALVVYTKYISPTYYYDITFDSNDMPILVVRQQIGKRYTTLCRIGISEIVKIEREGRKERRSRKTPEGYVRYSYLPTLNPAESYRLTTGGRYERAEILIESSEGFAELLTAYAAEAREYYKFDDEN